MSVQGFRDDPSRQSHASYRASLFDVTAPEYSEGEDLLGSAYRGLLLGILDSDVDARCIGEIPAHIPQSEGGLQLWEPLLRAGGLGSPAQSNKRRVCRN